LSDKYNNGNKESKAIVTYLMTEGTGRGRKNKTRHTGGYAPETLDFTESTEFKNQPNR